MKRRPKRTAKPVRMNAFQIDKMREAGLLAFDLLDAVEEMIGPGVSTLEIDQLVDELTREAGAVSAPLNYRGFPKHCCTSINDVVCHGIPNEGGGPPGGRHRQRRRDPDPRRVPRGQLPDLPDRRGVGDGETPGRDDPRGARGGDRRGEPRGARGRHRPRHPGPGRAPWLLRGARVHGPRHRPDLPHLPDRPSLRTAGIRRAAPAGHDLHDRTHDQRGGLAGGGPRGRDGRR